MSIKLNIDELKKTLELFYTLSGIRIVVFDENFQEVISYPESFCPFCEKIRSLPRLREKCLQSDQDAFATCRNSDGIFIHKCHAGLIEAAGSLRDHNKIIGYMMFGQITDKKDKAALLDFVSDINLKYGVHCTPKGLKYKSEKQINAAVQLLRIYIDYILLKEMVLPENHRITCRAKEYINANLSGDLKISDICAFSNTSRTKLYEIFKADCNMGVASYIKEKRLALAYNLLKTTELSVGEVSEKSGFYDYNYFSRVFKRRYGASPYKIISD